MNRWKLTVAWQAALLLWPLVQVMPLPVWLLEAVAPERAAEIREFAAAGVGVAPTISLYPAATWRALLALAAAATLFTLVRQACRRWGAGPAWLAVIVLVLGCGEALLGLRQHLEILAGVRSGEYAWGSFGNRNLLAAWLEGCYALALGLAAAGGAKSWAGATGAAAMAVTILCTRSRAGILLVALLTAMFAASQWRAGRKRAAAVAVAAAVLLTLAGARALAGRWTTPALEAEKQGRLAMWADAARAAGRYFPAGAGAGAFPWAFRRSRPYLSAYVIDHPHNEYLEAAVEWGIPATAAAVLAMAFLLVRIARRLPRNGERGAIGAGALAGAVAILAHAAVDFPLRTPSILLLAAALLGIAAGVAADDGKRRARATIAAALAVALGAWLAPMTREVKRDPSGLRRALQANPYQAPLWRELALEAEARREAAAALRYMGMAEKLEPHMERSWWAAANLRLRLGDSAAARSRFAELAAQRGELERQARALFPP